MWTQTVPMGSRLVHNERMFGGRADRDRPDLGGAASERRHVRKAPRSR